MAAGSRCRPRPERPGASSPFGLAPAILMTLMLCLPATARAQQPKRRPPADTTRHVLTPRDTTVHDTAQQPARDTVPPDTLPPDTLKQDTTKRDTTPPLPLVPFPAPRDSGATADVWVFDSDALLRSGATTLTDLIAQVPGVLAFRQGYYGQPETVSSLGSGGGTTHIYLDGVPLDALALTGADLSRLPLANLTSVRVQRGADGLRIDLKTAESHSARPYSYIEAQAGDPLALNVFRGLFLAPHFLVGPIALGVERTASAGLGAAEPANLFDAWAKWSVVRKAWGAQLEYSQVSASREGSTPRGGNLSRRDLILRARAKLLPHMVAELYAATSSVKDSVIGDSLQHTPGEQQVGARLGFDTPRLWADGAVRWRSTAWKPRLQADLHVGVHPLPLITVSAEGQWSDWRAAGATKAGLARVVLGPIAHFTLFAETSGGQYGLARPPWDGGTLPPDTTAADTTVVDTTVTDTTATDTTAADTTKAPPPPVLLRPASISSRYLSRAGIALDWGGLHVEAAGLLLRTDSVFSFGSPYDSVAMGLPGGQTRGFEVSGSLPLFWKSLRVGGSFTRWTNPALWAYLPRVEGRGGLYLHTIPLKSGNLEITANVEGVYRGAMLVPAATDSTGAATTGGYVVFSPRTVVNAYVQIRVVSVRVFVRYDNITAPLDNLDFPGRELLGQHIVYGVKWDLWN